MPSDRWVFIAAALVAGATFGWCAAAVQDWAAAPYFEPTDTNAARLGMLANDHLLDTLPPDARHVEDRLQAGDDGGGFWNSHPEGSTLDRTLRYPDGIDADDVERLARLAADAGWTTGQECDGDRWSLHGSKRRGPVTLSLSVSAQAGDDELRIHLSSEAVAEEPGAPDAPIPAPEADIDDTDTTDGTPAGTCLAEETTSR